MRNQIASIGMNQSEETYLLAPKSLYKGEPLCPSVFNNHQLYAKSTGFIQACKII